jgi:peroxiredoxin
LARLRDDYEEFRNHGAEILTVGPDGADAFERYWREQRLPFIGMPDPHHDVARRYLQEVNLLKLGRMPLVMVIDKGGVIRYVHYAASMSDIPKNQTLLEVIERIHKT